MHRRGWLRAVGGEGGQATVEFALVLPVLLFLLFGILEFGQLLFAYGTIQDAAWAGARLGSLPGTTQAQIVKQVDQSASGFSPADLMVTVTSPDTPPKQGDPITVTVAYTFDFSVGLFGAPVPLQAQSTLRAE